VFSIAYHVIGSTSLDIFHDLIEGCVALTVHFLLSHYCTGANKIVSLSYVNARPVEFDYGYSETRPSTILPQHLKENANLHQNGSQMWSLAKIWPLILEPLVPCKVHLAQEPAQTCIKARRAAPNQREADGYKVAFFTEVPPFSKRPSRNYERSDRNPGTRLQTLHTPGLSSDPRIAPTSSSAIA